MLISLTLLHVHLHYISIRYVWIDWSSMPQPSACPPSIDQEVKEELGTNLGKAVKSIPAYVLRSLLHSSELTHNNYSRTDT